MWGIAARDTVLLNLLTYLLTRVLTCLHYRLRASLDRAGQRVRATPRLHVAAAAAVAVAVASLVVVRARARP